jgi:hypothetical protein
MGPQRAHAFPFLIATSRYICKKQNDEFNIIRHASSLYCFAFFFPSLIGKVPFFSVCSFPKSLRAQWRRYRQRLLAQGTAFLICGSSVAHLILLKTYTFFFLFLLHTAALPLSLAEQQCCLEEECSSSAPASHILQ